jgi:hypothetical protein
VEDESPQESGADRLLNSLGVRIAHAYEDSFTAGLLARVFNSDANGLRNPGAQAEGRGNCARKRRVTQNPAHPFFWRGRAPRTGDPRKTIVVHEQLERAGLLGNTRVAGRAHGRYWVLGDRADRCKPTRRGVRSLTSTDVA